jgi:TonB-linked SusC/RagA family outer membrane protein
MKDNLKLLLNEIEWSVMLKFFCRFFLMLIIIVFMIPHSVVTAQEAQDITITGVITDASTGEPLPGVNIVIEGTFIGAVSDVNGRFTIDVPNEEAVLSFSFVGYAKKSVLIGQQRNLSIALEASTTQLEEVVFVGYGVQKKESIVGAISQTTGDIILQGTQGSDLGNALTGALPGLITISTTGLPGGAGEDDDYALLYIRGKKTWNNAEPLVLVDGVERSLHDVNPYEIESISVLKDASATAVFGVKGANGVILINTQRGKEGKAKLSVDATMTVKTISRIPKREGSYIANLMKNYTILNEVPISESSWNSIVPSRWLELYKSQEYPEYLPDVDWVEEFTKDYAMDKTINMTLTGGTKVVKYFGSLAYFNEGDILNIGDYGQGYNPNFAFDRLNFRSNMDFDLSQSTRLSANLSGYYSVQKRPGGDKYAGWPYLYSTPPDLWPPQYSDGTWADYAMYDRYSNGIYAFNFFGVDITKTTNITTDFMLDQKLNFITRGLSFNAKLSYDNTAYSSGPFIDGYGKLRKWIRPTIVDEITPDMTEEEIKELEAKYTIYEFPMEASTTGYDWVELPNSYESESASSSVYRSLYYQLSLNYARDFGKHSLGGLVLMSRQERAVGDNFPSYREDWVGRITYDYDRRYLLEFNGAYNGSEKFSKDYRFGFFPSMAVGWVVSNEKFFERLRPIVNNLKIRYSDGIVGSDEGIERWLYLGSWNVLPPTTSSSSEEIFRFGYPYLQNAYPLRYEGVIPNPDIQWETSHKRDLGIEMGFFENRIRLTFDYFTENRTNIFVTGSERVIPDYLGVNPVSANIGEVDMHGWEFESNFTHTTASGLNLWLSYAVAFAKDKIIERGDPLLKPGYQKQAGYQIDQPREVLNQSENPMLTWNEIYNSVQGESNSQLLPGDFAQVDFNSDGVIDANDDVPIGYPSRPQYSYAPSAGINYKNLSFVVRLYGVFNVQGEVGTYRGAFANQYSIVYPWNRDYAWSPEFDNTSTAINPGLRFNTSSSSGYIAQSRAYLKLQHVEIGYTLSSPWIKKVGLSSLRFILSGDNFILYSKMTEDLDADRPTVQTNTRRTYPKFSRFNLGVNFNFL